MSAGYVELHAHSAYSFLDGASLPEELAARAVELGYDAFALTDHDGVYGSLEFAHAAKHLGLRAITGAEVTLAGGRPRHAPLREPPRLREPLPDPHRRARPHTGRRARARPASGRDDAPSSSPSTPRGSSASPAAPDTGSPSPTRTARPRLAQAFPGAFYVELQRPVRARRRPPERGPRPSSPPRSASRPSRPATSTLTTHAAAVSRTPSSRSATARRSTAPSASGAATTSRCSSRRRRPPSGFQPTPPPGRARSPSAAPSTSPRSSATATPTSPTAPTRPTASCGDLCERAFADRYAKANGHKKRAHDRLETELALIARLGLAGFFLLHWEVLELARACALEVRGRDSPRNVLPPGRGRGSSVGSIVCYLTGLSHVDPVEANLSLGRFLNDELVSVPDIDLDFPRDIREKLIVAVTERYGREHAALVATFSTYRSRGAIRDVGKALGLPFAELERLARVTDGWQATGVAAELDERARQPYRPALAGLSRADPRDRRPAAPPLPAPRRDGDLDPAADRPRPGAARRDGRPPDLPVGQGLVRRCRLPQDRPARARDALRRRGGGRADRPPPRRADRPLADPARRPGGLPRDPGRRHRRALPDREPRPDAEPPAHPPREPRRPDRPGRARSARPDPGQGRPPLHRAPPAPARRPRVSSIRSSTSRSASRSGRRSASSSSRIRCSTSRWLPPLQRGGGRRAAPRDEPQAERGGDRGVPAQVRRRAASATGSTSRRRTRSTTSSSASPVSGSRSRTPPRSACSPTNRHGCGATTRPSSSARS